MKKYAFVAMLLVLALLVAQMSFTVAMASTNYEPCDRGDHVLELKGSYSGGYGGFRYFNVNRCQYASYPHQHFYITGQWVYVYECQYCGYTTTVTETYDDTEMGPICTLHDVGR